MISTKLGREDWIRVALDALLTEGPDAVAVQPLGRRLGATKGSFYWHFTGREDLLRATLARWETVATDEVIARTEAGGGSAADKAARLFAHVTASNEHSPGQLMLMAGTGQPDVRAVVERTTARRIDYVATLLRGTGLPAATARRRATLAYAAYLGHAQLVHTTPGVLPASARARQALLAEMVGVFLDSAARAG